MRIRAKTNFTGVLDLSTQERLGESNPLEAETMRAYIKPGETIDVDDKFFYTLNIQNALRLGYIDVLYLNRKTVVWVGTVPPDHPDLNELWVDTNP